MVKLGIESLKVELVAWIPEDETIGVSEEVCPLTKTSMDDIRALPHGFKIPFSNLIMGLVIDNDEPPLVKGTWVDMGVIMGL